MRSRASVILDNTYWPAIYPRPNTPALIAKLVRFRRSQRLVADIIFIGEEGDESLQWRVLVVAKHNNHDKMGDAARLMAKGVK